MAPRLCVQCALVRARVRRPRDGRPLCVECFFRSFEDEVHRTIVQERLFAHGERVAIGASGGKDSTVLAFVLQLLNERHGYGVELRLLSIDEGIRGYRDDSLQAVARHSERYKLPLDVLSYSQLYGWTMDGVVEHVGRRGNCTYCGVFRRQALDRGADLLEADKLVTGHNADDIAETVVMNLLRGDLPRLLRCSEATTTDGHGGGGGGDGGGCGADGRAPTAIAMLPRVKPFKYTYEKDIVMYAHFRRLDYFATECIYSPEAFRGHARQFIKDLEQLRSRVIVDIIASAERFTADAAAAARAGEGGAREGGVDGGGGGARAETRTGQTLRACAKCGYMTSQKLCKACELREHLEQRREQRRQTESGAVEALGEKVRAVVINPP